jgi:O-acetylhomoserine/O-acetylserine sulfhydrylase-like pyridoxal-dependent enzyme
MLASRLIGKRIERLGIVVTSTDKYITWDFRSVGGSIIRREDKTDETPTFEQMPRLAKQIQMMEYAFWFVYERDPLTATVFLLKVMDRRSNRDFIDEIIRVFSLPNTRQERFWWSKVGIERHIQKFYHFCHTLNETTKEGMVKYSKLR